MRNGAPKCIEKLRYRPGHIFRFCIWIWNRKSDNVSHRYDKPTCSGRTGTGVAGGLRVQPLTVTVRKRSNLKVNTGLRMIPENRSRITYLVHEAVPHHVHETHESLGLTCRDPAKAVPRGQRHPVPLVGREQAGTEGHCVQRVDLLVREGATPRVRHCHSGHATAVRSPTGYDEPVDALWLRVVGRRCTPGLHRWR